MWVQCIGEPIHCSTQLDNMIDIIEWQNDRMTEGVLAERSCIHMDTWTWPDQPILSKDYNIDIEPEVVTAVTLIDASVTTMSTLIHYYSDWLRLKRGVAIYLRCLSIWNNFSLQIFDRSCNPDITMDNFVVADRPLLDLYSHWLIAIIHRRFIYYSHPMLRVANTPSTEIKFLVQVGSILIWWR